MPEIKESELILSEHTVTVIVCTYNGEKYISEQLDSLLAQTYKKMRIVIYDDLSTDATWEVLSRYAMRYESVSIVRNDRRLGVVANFERAIAKTDTPYIALCDQDDIWFPDKLERSVKMLEPYDDIPAYIHTDLCVVDENANVVHPSFFRWKGYVFPEKKSTDILISRSGVMGNTVVMNRRMKARVLPFLSADVMHDYHIGVIGELFGKRITLREPTLYYRIHGNNAGNRRKSLKEKISAFFSDPLPYGSLRPYLQLLLKRKPDISDRNIIEDFIVCISYKSFASLVRCLYRKHYFKADSLYRLRVLVRYLFARKGMR